MAQPRAARLAGVLLLTLCGAACSPPGRTDAGAEDATPGDGTANGSDARRGDGGLPPLDVVRSDATGVNNGACSTIMNLAPPIGETVAAGAVPRGNGGAIVRGWYYLTRSTVYRSDLDAGGDAGGVGGGPLDAGELDASADAHGDGAPADARTDAVAADASPDVGSGPTRQSSLLVSGGAAFVIMRAGTSAATTANYRLDEDAGASAFVPVCPTADPPVVDSYDATPTGLVLYRAAEGRVDTYTRQ